MASILDISISSDSEDDADYVPNVPDGESSCDEGDVVDCNEDLIANKTKTTERSGGDETKASPSVKIDEKQRAKDLWESFLNDVESETPKDSNSPICKGSITNVIQSETETPKINSKPICKVFEFAGETVTVLDKDINSCDSELQQETLDKNNSGSVPTYKPPSLMPKKRGLDSVLGTIMNKHKKLSVLDKSLLDWKTFKKDEGLDSELEQFNKGKQGFIERQRFLERSDLRTFEMEKSIRQKSQKK